MAQSPDDRIHRLLDLLQEHATVVVSGTKMAEEIGVPRSTLHGWIDRLRDLGVELKGVPATGYQLVRLPDILTPRAIRAAAHGTVFGQRLRSSFDSNNDSNRERKDMWQAGLAISAEHPWLGVGDAMESFAMKSGGQAQGYYHRYLSDEGRGWYASKGIPPYERGHLHNNAIQIAAMYGLPALFCLAAFLFSLFFRALGEGWREPSGLGLGFAGAWLAWNLNGLFEFNLGSVQSSFVFWFLCGLWLSSRKAEA